MNLDQPMNAQAPQQAQEESRTAECFAKELAQAYTFMRECIAGQVAEAMRFTDIKFGTIEWFYYMTRYIDDCPVRVRWANSGSVYIHTRNISVARIADHPPGLSMFSRGGESCANVPSDYPAQCRISEVLEALSDAINTEWTDEPADELAKSATAA